MLEINSVHEARLRGPDRLTFRTVSRSRESKSTARRDPEPSHFLTMKPKLNPRWYPHLTAVTNCLSLRLPCRLRLELALFPFRCQLPAVFDSPIQPVDKSLFHYLPGIVLLYIGLALLTQPGAPNPKNDSRITFSGLDRVVVALDFREESRCKGSSRLRRSDMFFMHGHSWSASILCSPQFAASW
jgi:hypothetical protein